MRAMSARMSSVGMERGHHPDHLVRVMQVHRDDRHAGGGGDLPEPDPPARDLRARAFRRDPDPAALAVAQQGRQLVQHVAAGVRMRGDAAVATQDRAQQRDPEQHVLAEDADVDAHRGRGEIHPEAVPVGRVRRGDEHRLRQVRQRAAHAPAAAAQQPCRRTCAPTAMSPRAAPAAAPAARCRHRRETRDAVRSSSRVRRGAGGRPGNIHLSAFRSGQDRRRLAMLEVSSQGTPAWLRATTRMTC